MKTKIYAFQWFSVQKLSTTNYKTGKFSYNALIQSSTLPTTEPKDELLTIEGSQSLSIAPKIKMRGSSQFYQASINAYLTSNNRPKNSNTSFLVIKIVTSSLIKIIYSKAHNYKTTNFLKNEVTSLSEFQRCFSLRFSRILAFSKS